VSNRCNYSVRCADASAACAHAHVRCRVKAQLGVACARRTHFYGSCALHTSVKRQVVERLTPAVLARAQGRDLGLSDLLHPVVTDREREGSGTAASVAQQT